MPAKSLVNSRTVYSCAPTTFFSMLFSFQELSSCGELRVAALLAATWYRIAMIVQAGSSQFPNSLIA